MGTSARLDELKRKFDENPRRYFAPLANEYRKQGDTTQAIALCRTHLPNQPGHISGHIVLAQALYESRELVESRQMFEAALELDPENLIALRYLGDISREQGSPADAQAWYKRVLEFDPRNEEISQLLADVSQAADVAIAELSSQPTPPAGVPVFEADETPHAGVALTPEVAEPATEPVSEEFLSTDLSFDAPEASSGVSGESMDEVEAVAMPSEEVEAVSLPSDEIDLYGGDPSGDDWRHSIGAAPETPSEGLSLDADEVLGSHSEAHDLGELEAMVEPSASDWFAGSGSVEAVHEESLEEASPDAAMDENLADDVDAAFGWPASDVEANDEVNAAFEGVEPQAASPEGASEFSDWGSSESSAEAPNESRPVVDAWGSIQLPSISDELDEQPAGVEGAEDAYAAGASLEGVQAFDANDAASLVEEEPVAETSFYGESLSFAEESIATSSEEISEEVVSSEEPQEIDSYDGFVTADTGVDSAAVVDEGSVAYEDFGELDEESVGAEHPADPDEDSDPLIGRTPSFVPAVSDEPPAPFVTETMAELYLQQGFNEEALAVYRELLSRNPDDQALQDRVRMLEGGESAMEDFSVSVPEPTVATESARSFFARFANRRLSGGPRGNASEDAGQAATASTVPLAGAAMPDEALTRPDESTLTHIFSGQTVPATDAEAATTLASAFGVVEQAPSGELSLERLFRDVPPHSTGAVTLDETGGGSAASSSQQQVAGEDVEGEAPADYEQFTAWLEGLKKK